MPFFTQQNPNGNHFYPRIGMRKVKSILAIVIGFFLWQGLRLILPELEVHPIFIYIYGMIEIRENSDKTRDYGKLRILATVIAIAVGIPVMVLHDWLKPMISVAGNIWMELGILTVGALLALLIAEWARCRDYCGLAAVIFVILLVSHFESSMYLYSLMRVFQTVIGVLVAWVINVKLLPFPSKPGTLGYWLEQHMNKKKE